MLELPGGRRLWSEEAEQAVIGAAMLGREAAGDVVGTGLLASHFFDAGHQLIWNHVAALCNSGRPVDVITLSERLQQSGEIERVGGAEYLVAVSNGSVSSANAVAYADIVKSRAFQRHYHGLLLKACEGFSDPTIEDPVAMADQLLASLEANHTGSELVPISGVAAQYVDILEERFNNPGIQGLSTGYSCIDHRLNGMKGGELIVIAARPGMGKTNYILNILRNSAVQHGAERALGFTLEMGNSQLVERLLAAQGKIQKGLLQTGKVFSHEDSMARLTPAMAVIKAMDVLLCDSPTITVQEVCAMSRREARRKKVGMVFVDYLGLVEYSGNESRHDLKIAEITRSLKKLAREIDCPVLLLSQLSRKVEERKDKRPIPSDLKDSGAIEADADVIQFLYRDEVYNENTQHKGQVEIITAKGRECELGTDYLTWRGEYALMESNSTRDAPPRETEYQY